MSRSAGARGGAANEAGSLHRGGVAAYVAAHGLVGQGLVAAGYQACAPVPVALRFETGDEVDDIRCELSDGAVLLLQAKRSCGADRHLTATVKQWTSQLPHLSAGDRIGLATRTARGAVRDLGGRWSEDGLLMVATTPVRRRKRWMF